MKIYLGTFPEIKSVAVAIETPMENQISPVEVYCAFRDANDNLIAFRIHKTELEKFQAAFTGAV